MLNKVLCAIFYGIPAMCMSTLAICWWVEFGTNRPYPYIATVGAVLCWLLVYGAYNEKED